MLTSRRIATLVWVVVLLHSVWVPGSARAQKDDGEGVTIVGVPWKGKPGVTESVSDIMTRERRSGSQVVRQPRQERRIIEYDIEETARATQVLDEAAAGIVADKSEVIPAEAGALNGITAMDAPSQFGAQSLGSSFVAATYLVDSGDNPPSPMAAVGPTQILMVINGRVRTFTKAGVADGALNTSSNQFFSSVSGGPQIGTTDPRVVYDRLAQRWFVVMLSKETVNKLLIAISDGPTITPSTVFKFYGIQHDTIGPAGNQDTGKFADFSTLGVDNNAVYIGINIFTCPSCAGPASSTVFVFRKSDLLAGAQQPTVTPFRFTYPAGVKTPQGVTNMDSTLEYGYFIGNHPNANFLRILRITNPGTTPTLTTLSNINPPGAITPSVINVPAKDSAKPLDGLDHRLSTAMIVRNPNGTNSLWTGHNMQMNSSGTIDTAGGRNGMRYYELINLTSASPTVRQALTVYDPATTNPLSYWVGSVATSGQGHTVMASSYAGVNAYAGIAFSGRLNYPLDPLNTFTSLGTNAGNAAFNAETGSITFQRWGDYSNVVVDPSDNMTMWSFQEKTTATDTWGVVVTKHVAPLPATPATASPVSAPAGSSSVNITITGNVVSGSGFYDPGAGFDNHISATVNGGGVTVTNVTYNSPTEIVLTLNIAANAAQTTRSVTVFNPDGQSITGSTNFQITGPVITLSPITVPTGQVGVAYSQTISASGGGSPYAYSLFSGSLPNGINLNTSNGTISGTPTVSGTWNFTIRATDAFNNTGNRSYTLVIELNITNSVTLSLVDTSYDPTTFADCASGSSGSFVGSYAINTSITNTGPTINSPIFFKIVQLVKFGVDQNPSVANRLLTADSLCGTAGDLQTLGVGSLSTSVPVPVSFLIALGSRQTFSILVDLYTIMPGGSGLTSLDNDNGGMVKASADTAVQDRQKHLGRFVLNIPETRTTALPTAPDFTLPDPLSNVGVITGSGPQSRPAVAVDPVVSKRIAIASNDYDSQSVKVSTSQDGGKTWRTTTMSRSAGGQQFYSAQNPSLAFDSQGKLSVVYTVANLGDSANAVVITESTDGINFGSPVVISSRSAADKIVDSRPVIAIKPKSGRYVAWDSFSYATLRYSINVARSEESGAFAPATTVVSNGQFSSPTLALSKDEVYLGWDEWGFNSSAPFSTGGRLMVTSSPAGAKINFDTPRLISRTNIGFSQRIPAMPERGVAPNLSLLADPIRDSVVYAAFTDQGKGTDIRFARSGNGGKTWQVTTANNDTGAADQFSPALTADADGNVKISFYDTRLSSQFEAAHIYLARTVNGETFDNQRVTTLPSDDSKSNLLRDYTANLGDRSAIAMADGDVLIAWTDTRSENEDVYASVVSDPDGEFVTGSGKITSAAGSFPLFPALTARVDFGFDAKYKKHASLPVGDTEVIFQVGTANFRFKSTSYEWLAVSGGQAQFAGSGKVNGLGDFRFLVTAYDGNKTGGPDKFRIKIVDKGSGAILYDNVPGAPDGIDTANPQPIGSGKIEIRK